jgi:hypothetical protein
MFSLKKITAQPHVGWLVFFTCWLTTALVYYPAHDAMLIDDGVNAIQDIQQQGFSGLLHSYHFDSFYHGYYLILNVLYALFGLNATGWFFFFSLMHALNCALLYKVIYRLLTTNRLSTHCSEISLFATLFFLLSPYNAENIVWAATTHYVVGLSILFYSMQWIDSFLLKHSSSNGYLVFLFLNVFALFTFELNFLSPFIYLLMYALYTRNKCTDIRFKTFVSRIILPIVLAILIYLMLLYIDKGTLMLHNGKGAILLPPVQEIIAQYGRHLIRLFSFSQYASIQWRERVYAACEHWMIVSLVIVCMLTFFYSLARKKSIEASRVFLFFFFIGFIFILPFTRVYFVYIFKYENIRYTYFAAAFLLSGFVFFLFQINRLIRYIILTVYLSLCLFFTIQTVNDKRESGIVYHRFIESFPATSASKIFLLNTPSFCNESYMFWDRSRLPIALSCYRHLDVSNQLEQVLFYNSISDKDTFKVKKINDSCWTFQLKADGSWLMDNYMGASDVENERFRCDVDEWGGYKLQFKKRLNDNEDIIYFNGQHFTSIK